MHEYPPCYGCPNRYPACHGSCESYKAWKERLVAQQQHYQANRYRWSIPASENRDKCRGRFQWVTRN